MCGIAGFWRRGGLDGDARAALTRMTDAIARRGPDDSGEWLDEAAGIALGHRRLSIIDLSPAGHQPMVSADGRFILVVNGEIYNFMDLRADLERAGRAPEWRGTSDSEVLLAAISAWGMKRTLEQANGMFALALWDRQQRTLTLARDRMGEKPLYYGWNGHGAHRTLLFGSDLSALRCYPGFAAEVSKDSVAMLARFLYIPEPYSIYQGVSKLMPGTFAIFAADGGEATETYWNTLAEFGVASRDRVFAGSPEEAVDGLEQVLMRAIERQSVADVPLGAFLSGGIDSSAVVALMQAQSTRPVKTFSIGFQEKDHNEAEHARAVALHLGTDHHELILSPDDALAVIPDLPDFYAEPFADSSQIPTYLVARMAKENVTVALSGDAGDEMFGGYNRYTYTRKYWPLLSRVPTQLRRSVAAMVSAVPPRHLDRFVGPVASRFAVNVGEKLHKMAGIAGSRSTDELYRNLISINRNADKLTKGGSGSNGFECRDLVQIAGVSPVDRMMALDAVHYLPGDILAKVDRAAMAVGLECRVPMLDVEVMRFAWSLPVSHKIREGVSKWPLRQLLYRHVPQALVDRPKMGFGIPIGPWLRGPLRDWAEELLNDRSCPASDYFDIGVLMRLWNDHQAGSKNNQHQLWPALMLQAWRTKGPPGCVA
jgi:asparagine synthase (glutamine-hydrolysing)